MTSAIYQKKLVVFEVFTVLSYVSKNKSKKKGKICVYVWVIIIYDVNNR